MLAILKDLFVNFTIIIATLTLGNMLVREGLTIKRSKYSIIISLLSGVFGCLLMLFSVRVSPDIIIDFRCIPILLMGIYFSLPASIITASIIGIFRVAVYGINLVSIIALFVALVLGLLCGLIGRKSFNIKTKWLLCGITACVIPGVAFVVLLLGSDNLYMVAFSYLFGTAISVFLTALFMKYITNSNQEYYHTKEALNKDFLTGLQNIRHFDTSLNQLLGEAKKAQKHISLLFIDIDFFKKVNDIYGHLNGDRVLKEVGQILIKLSRDTDIVARKGGEEFTVLLMDCGVSKALKVAERIRKTIEENIFISEQNEEIRITISIGVSSFPDTIADEEKLTEQADIALYRAKRSGRNKVCLAP